ncbi:MAG: sigma-54-dependent Fis family transcriptional regulator [Candidatus Latescibacteria bacterium]|nr:sigma-54-dependent Fis family transcriptional regulator [Candidatus Latescibacterota bacterium]
MQRVLQQLQEVATTPLTVLLLGETGTGKGVAARTLHQWSRRRHQPFVHLDCGSLPQTLLESELFGHEKGAFTGASTPRRGRIEQAQGGTLFLDEIGELPLESQTRLLRLLQDRQIERVGGSQTIPVDVRVVAATHRDLAKAVPQGSFREDLYYRLKVFPIEIPPLRKRPEDIPHLADHFLGQMKDLHPQLPPRLGPAGLQALQAHNWPGNVRELEHLLQRAAVLARGGEIRPEHLGLAVPVSVVAPARSAEPLTILPLVEHERRYLAQVLAHTKGVIHGPRGAARLLGIKPTTLRSRLLKLGLMQTRNPRQPRWSDP